MEGTRINTSTNNLCFEQKLEEYERFLFENCHGYSLEIDPFTYFTVPLKQTASRSYVQKHMIESRHEKTCLLGFDPVRHKTFVWFEALRPSQQFFSHVGTELPLPGYYQYFLGGECILLKDTTRRPE